LIMKDAPFCLRLEGVSFMIDSNQGCRA
jgi:hypothetical protein